MATKKSKSEKLLEDIWTTTAESFAAILRDTPHKELSAAMLATAAKFLNDNGVRKDTLEDTKQAKEEARHGAMSADIERALIDSQPDEVPPLPEPTPDHAIEGA